MYFIAEIGFNHEGDLNLADKMIQAAAQSGANAVKFQTFRADDIALPSSPHYQTIQCGELNYKQHMRLYQTATENNVHFLSTPFSPSSVELLEKVGVVAYKIASMDCTNRHLLGYVTQTKKPIYLSTGMASLAEIAETVEFLEAQGSGPVSLLHCISKYPAVAEELNLGIIPLLKRYFGLPIGYSDHFSGTKACLAAALLGAEIIESHFTLDSNNKSGDHPHSVEPAELKTLISDIHLFTTLQGDANNIFHRPDRELSTTYRRGLYTTRQISSGEVLREEDIFSCRPVAELSPNDIGWLIGKRINQDLSPHTAISIKHITNDDPKDQWPQ